MSARGRASEIMVEGDDAMHLGAADVQRLRNVGQQCIRYPAKMILKRVEQRQQASPLAGIARQQRPNMLLVVS
jgi:hypothetical protein